MTVKEEGFDETSLELIRNFNMAKGILQRRNTCENFGSLANTSTVRRSFRLLGSKQNDIIRENGNIHQGVKPTKTDKSRHIIQSPEIGRRNISVARVAEVFHELQQKLVTRSKHNDENDDTRKNTSSLLKFELSKRGSNQVSSRINMFNKVSTPSKKVDDTEYRKYDNKDSNNNTNNKNLKNKGTPDKRCRDTKENQKKVVIMENGATSISMAPEITEEEMIIIKKRKAIGRSNSAMIPLRELVMTRETAKSRRSLSFSLIPEDDTLSLTEAVERRLNLSKETNLCDTDL